MGRPGNKVLNPQERRKAIELKLERDRESGCGLLKFLVKERRNGGIRRIGVSLKKTRISGES